VCAAYSQDVIETSSGKAKILKKAGCDFVKSVKPIVYGEK
jgi:hypothetical protein